MPTGLQSVEDASRGKVAPEWLLEDDASPGGRPRRPEVSDHVLEQGRRDREMVEWTPCAPEFPLQGGERLRVLVGAVYEPQQVRKSIGGGGSPVAANLWALPGPFSQALQISGSADSDDRQGEALVV